jgi:uncharacterized protein YjbI with pentapeptide repeats
MQRKRNNYNQRDLDRALAGFKNLSGAVLSGADLTNADLTGADLTKAVLSGADLTNADLIDADLPEANRRRAILTEADMTRAILTRANLTRANLTEADLTDARLNEAILTEANLTDAILTDAKLWNAVLFEANLTRADLTRAELLVVNMYRADLTDAILTKAHLDDAWLVHADLTRADLTGAQLNDANLVNATLTEAKLINATLNRADLSGANLTGADLSGAILRGIEYDEYTRWPAGFTPSNKADVNIVYRFCGTNECIGGASARNMYVASLTSYELEKEGDDLGICVGEPRYVDDVSDGIINIYSIRTETGRPKFAIEHRSDGAIGQIKGKANRLPGYLPREYDLKKTDEVRLVVEFLTFLGMTSDEILRTPDIAPGVHAMIDAGQDPFSPPTTRRQLQEVRANRANSERARLMAMVAYNQPWGGVWGKGDVRRKRSKF